MQSDCFWTSIQLVILYFLFYVPLDFVEILEVHVDSESSIAADASGTYLIRLLNTWTISM